jgi:hypothetical protein
MVNFAAIEWWKNGNGAKFRRSRKAQKEIIKTVVE